MEMVKATDGFDSTSTADILTFELEEVQLLQALDGGADIDQVAERLKMGEIELDACIQNLIINMPNKTNQASISLARAQLRKIID